jgi:hypothetical protein
LKNKFGVTVLSSPKKPETPLDTIPTPNKEIVVVRFAQHPKQLLGVFVFNDSVAFFYGAASNYIDFILTC